MPALIVQYSLRGTSVTFPTEHAWLITRLHWNNLKSHNLFQVSQTSADVQISLSGTLHPQGCFREWSCTAVTIFKISANTGVKATLPLTGFTVLPQTEILSMLTYPGIWGAGFVKWNEQLHMLLAVQKQTGECRSWWVLLDIERPPENPMGANSRLQKCDLENLTHGSVLHWPVMAAYKKATRLTEQFFTQCMPKPDPSTSHSALATRCGLLLNQLLPTLVRNIAY